MCTKVNLVGSVLIVSVNNQLEEMRSFESPVALKEELNGLRMRGAISSKRHAHLIEQVERHAQHNAEPTMRFK